MKSTNSNPFHIQLPAFLIAAMLIAVPLFAAPFTDNGDGTVSDSATNLRWQKCSGTEAQGSISNDNSHNATCSGTEIPYTWANALSYCNNLSLAGLSWRLPSLLELESIVDGDKANPAIDATRFPATVAGYYWSASTYVSTTDAWRVHFGSGNSSNGSKTRSFSVRCVAPGP